MSAITIRNEDDLADSGNQLVPMKGEIEVIPHGLVWEMNEEEFAAFASQFSTAQCAAMIRESLQQCLASLKRTAEWYYAAGRWLAWVKEQKLYESYGGWEVFCKKECKISPSQAWKYKEFAERFKPEQIESFDGERFSLERALGYEAKAQPSGKKKERRAEAPEKQHHADKEPQTPESQESQVEEEAQPDEADEAVEAEKEQDAEEQDEPEKPNEWGFSETTKTTVALQMPGQFVIQLSDGDEFFLLNLNRPQMDKLYRQLGDAMDKDDEYKPDALPE